MCRFSGFGCNVCRLRCWCACAALVASWPSCTLTVTIAVCWQVTWQALHCGGHLQQHVRAQMSRTVVESALFGTALSRRGCAANLPACIFGGMPAGMACQVLRACCPAAACVSMCWLPLWLYQTLSFVSSCRGGNHRLWLVSGWLMFCTLALNNTPALRSCCGAMPGLLQPARSIFSLPASARASVGFVWVLSVLLVLLMQFREPQLPAHCQLAPFQQRRLHQ